LDGSSNDDDDEWITAENMHEQGCDTTDSSEDIARVQVAVMSTDFAMQVESDSFTFF
jgi:hypothetical protein